jgi:hypothetical protein
VKIVLVEVGRAREAASLGTWNLGVEGWRGSLAVVKANKSMDLPIWCVEG